jgi:hypothetical protein
MTVPMHDELAKIVRVSLGMISTRGDDVPALIFEIELAISSACLYFYENEALEFIKKHNIKNALELVGSLCVVRTGGWGSTVTFERMHNYISA